MQKDPYFCLSCGFKGEVNGIITITTACDKCKSLLIVPLSSLHLIELDELPGVQAKSAKKRHLQVVKNEDEE